MALAASPPDYHLNRGAMANDECRMMKPGRDGMEIDGATNAFLTLRDLDIADGGRYDVLIVNDVGATTSRPIHLPVPALSSQTSKPAMPAFIPLQRAIFTGPSRAMKQL